MFGNNLTLLNKNKMEEMHINWAAYGLAVVAQIIIGYIWFHPSVMGKMWAKANGIEIKDIMPKNPGMAYGLSILLTLFFTMFMVTNVTGPGQDTAPDGHSYHTFQHGIAHAIVMTLMIIVPIFGTLALFTKKNWAWFIVQTGYWFLRMFVAFGILSAWR